MWEAINSFLTTVDNLVWGVPLMVLIMAGGILLTARLGLLQMRRLPLALKWMFKNEEEGDGEISSFAALCTALSATIGTGNIVGVATAVCGGKGCENPESICITEGNKSSQSFRETSGTWLQAYYGYQEK